MPTVKEVDALLPQTQCGECGFSGCLPYAEALVQGTALINQCPPGGVATLKALGSCLDINPEPWFQEMAANTRAPSVAGIRGAGGIGCTKCIKACPVDAIMGSAKLMHSILSHECTGCGLCVEPCPVDCIEMVEIPQVNYDKERARRQFQQKKARSLREEHAQQQAYREKRLLAKDQNQVQDDIKAKQDYIALALARVQAKRNNE